MADHADYEVVARALELLNGPPYFNVATESNGKPWDTPLWAARDRDPESVLVVLCKERSIPENIGKNPRTFLTIFDSTRKRGTNNLRCLYLQCTTVAVQEQEEAREASALVYPGETVALSDFLGSGQKRFYRATPLRRGLTAYPNVNLHIDSQDAR